MKTAVSIPDPVFKAADRLAHRLGMSRSSLYAEALHRYLQLHDEHAITSKLNAVLEHETSELHPHFQSIQSRSIPRESWK
jgi:metal-responsive CopG/Arc/MetJ family transcriptional regulator